MVSHKISYANWRSAPRVFKALVANDPNILPFISAFPDRKGFEGVLTKRPHPAGRRKTLVNVLKSQHSQSTHAAVHANIAALEDAKTFTVTTGHQLTLFTGPAYFVYKIAHAIALARDLQRMFPSYRFVPVYWMASEDHDFAEVNHVNTTRGKVEWLHEAGGAVGELTTEGLQLALNELAALLGWTPEDERYNLLAQSLAKPDYSSAARTWVDALFGDSGLLVLDASDRALKHLFVPYMCDDVRHQTGFKTVSEQSVALEAAGFGRQINPREINLFYLSLGHRERIEAAANGAYTAGSQRWESTDALCAHIETEPEKFSPNVVLRPLYQEVILPNLCYIGGGGELAYWLQLKALFTASDVAFPVLLPRNGVTVLNAKDADQAQEFGFLGDGLFAPIDGLVKTYLGEQHDDHTYFAAMQAELKTMYARIAERLTAIDASLEGRALAALARQEKELDGLEKSALKARKQREEVMVNRIQRVHAAVYPNGELQERFLNYFELDGWLNGTLLRYCLTEFSGLEPAMHVVTPLTLATNGR
jgi:bacillithiol biosynthesis cysteine-adding enzyme BshC